MLKTIIIPLCILCILANDARAQARKDKVLIYNHEITFEKSILADKEETPEEERYDYYSTIIPHTLARNLQKAGKFEIQRIDEMLQLEGMGSDLFYKQMEKLGREHSAQYIIAGSSSVRGKKLKIDLTVINFKKKDFSPITKESFETGAELINIIDDLSAEAGQKLETYQKENAKRYYGESPFLKTYRALEGFSFGVKTGRFFIKGAFSHLYEDAEYINPYLFYDATSWFGVSAEGDYLNTKNGKKIVSKKSSMLLWGLSLNANFTYWLFKNFGIRLSGGFGASIGRIYLGATDNPFNELQSRKQTTDAYLNVSATFNLRFKPVDVQFGSSYKHVFFRGRPLQLITVFCGIGFHL
jgi:TolB-like protein